ncbi:hypothetical protein T440DRAFT_493913 [Plenodomus tracheiphilus IPT5]|uniref:Uncharacterized protein n=1 Tax=Plenodomus tracheiphilus IPT5 TaxID=1408161 RepID=A0A6A7ARE7_9PLEO|nr:hypothetical protein T440DRAFT_493913 [Plenodomus tracheiphilus IPT5]
MEAENLRLQTELEHTKWGVEALTQERDQWKNKFQNSQRELFQINGDSARTNREIKLLKEDNKSLQDELQIRNKTVGNATAKSVRLEGELKDLMAKLEVASRNFDDLLLETLQNAPEETGPTHDEFEQLQAQLGCLQEKNAMLSAISHPDESCQEYSTRAWHQVQDAKQLQAAAELETEALRHVQTQIILLNQQADEDAERITGLVEENMQLLSKVNNASGSSSAHSEEMMVHEPRRSLEAELESHHDFYSSILHSSQFAPLSSQFTPAAAYGRTYLPSPPQAQAAETLTLSSSLPAPPCHPVLFEPTLVLPATHLGLSKTHELSTEPIEPDPNVALTINLKAKDRKNWALLSRVQSAISKTSTLDVQGPTDLVNTFVKELNATESNHQKATANATHWQKVALDELAEVKILRKQLQKRPRCIDAAHRHLKDELEAKDSRLRMQDSLLADWRMHPAF